MRHRYLFRRMFLLLLTILVITGIAGATISTAAALADVTAEAAEASNLQIHVMDVGEGLGILLESDGEYMLYDGGGRDYSSKVVSYLKEQGVADIKYLVASHYDEDHIAGLVGALHVFDVENVLGPHYSVDTAIYESFFRALQEKQISLTTPAQGTTFDFGSCQATLLNASIAEEENDYSLVLRITCGDNSIILTGDATENSEYKIISSWDDIASDILIAGHHGSLSSTSDALLEAVDPETVVISCGLGNSYGHPAAGTMQRLKNRGVQILRTDLQGDLRMTSDGEKWTYDPEPTYEYSDGGDGGVLTLVPTTPSDPSLTDGVRALPGTDQENANEETEFSYVLNTNTRKFHYPVQHSQVNGHTF